MSNFNPRTYRGSALWRGKVLFFHSPRDIGEKYKEPFTSVHIQVATYLVARIALALFIIRLYFTIFIIIKIAQKTESLKNKQECIPHSGMYLVLEEQTRNAEEEAHARPNEPKKAPREKTEGLLSEGRWQYSYIYSRVVRARLRIRASCRGIRKRRNGFFRGFHSSGHLELNFVSWARFERRRLGFAS